MAYFLATPSNSANLTSASETSLASSPTPQASVTSSPKRKGKQRQLEPDPGDPEQQQPFLEEPQQQHHHEALTSPRLPSLTIGAYGGGGGEENGLLTPLTSHTMVAEHREADIDESGWNFGYSFGVDVSRVLDFAGSGSGSESGIGSPLASGSSVSSGLSSGFGVSDSGMSATTRVESSRRATMGDTTLRTVATPVSGYQQQEEEEGVTRDQEYETTLGDRSAGWGDLLIQPSRPNATPGPSRAVLQEYRNGDWAGMPPATKVREEDTENLKKHRRRPSSGLTTLDKTKLRTSTHHRRRSSRGGKVDEPGFSRDFLLIVALCIVLACASICIVRPPMMAWSGVAYYEDLLDFD